MTTEIQEQVESKKLSPFWKDFVTMTDYFSHAILPLQSELGVESQNLFYTLGRSLGEKAAQRGESFFDSTCSWISVVMDSS